MPAYNEEANLGSLVPEVLKSLQALGGRVEIIVVNDGSKEIGRAHV